MRQRKYLNNIVEQELLWTGPSLAPDVPGKCYAGAMHAARPFADGTTREPTVGAVRPPRVAGGLPVLGHALALGRDPDRFMARCRATYGDAFTLVLPGMHRTFLLDPRDTSRYFAERRFDFHRVGAEIGGAVFGYDVERAAQPDMEHYSPMLARQMRGGELQAMSERMQSQFLARVRGALGAREHEVNLLEFLSEHFFAAGLEAFFGEGIYSRELYLHYARLDRYFGPVAAGMPAWLFPGYRAAQRALARAARPLYPGRAHVFELRRQGYEQLEIPVEQWSHFDASLIWASQANTVVAAFWTVRYVLGDPAAKAAILEQTREVVGDPSFDQPLSAKQLASLTRLDSAVLEAMRLSASPIVTRRLHAPVTFETAAGSRLRLDAGSEVSLYPRITHLDREVFDDPYTFRHDRFVGRDGRPPVFERRGHKLKQALLPFGGGISKCPGRHFALNEIKILVAMLLGSLDAELTTTELPGMDFSRTGLGVLPPVSDVRLRLCLSS